MTATSVWAGVIVSSLDDALPWYREVTGVGVAESGEGWAVLRFPDGSGFELCEGDPSTPGLVFPSYGADGGPPVMPGFAVEDVEAVLPGLTVARTLPGWVVVVAPGGLRVVLTEQDAKAGEGLVGFEITCPQREELVAFCEHVGATVVINEPGALRVVPVVRGRRDADVTDPDGNLVRLVSR